jgi:hypothetical protein
MSDHNNKKLMERPICKNDSLLFDEDDVVERSSIPKFEHHPNVTDSD